MLVDPSGIPLAVSLTGRNGNDVTHSSPSVDGVGPVRGNVGRPRQRAEARIADRGYDHDKYRREPRRQADQRPPRGQARSRPWKLRSVVALLPRERLRWAGRPELHEACLHFACAIIGQRYLRALSNSL